jgi:hypothetical protein
MNILATAEINQVKIDKLHNKLAAIVLMPESCVGIIYMQEVYNLLINK